MNKKSNLALPDQIPYPEGPDSPQGESQLVVILGSFYRQRLRLLYYLLLFLGIGLTAYFLSAKTAEGLLTLAFPGIEKHEYPSGKQFNVEDFRNPQILINALGDVGIPREQIDLRKAAGSVYVTPVIPNEVINRWKKQEREGSGRESFYPYEFRIGIAIAGVSDQQRIRLFDALVKRYQEQVKYEQRTGLNFLSGGRTTSYEDLSLRYDYWDIPSIFEDIHNSLSRQLSTLIVESLKTRDSRFQLKFRDLDRNLHIWNEARLQALEAVTYRGGLVKDKDLTMKRIRFQLEDLAIRIRQKTDEADEGTALLEKVERPKALMTGQLSNRESMSMVDSTALDRFVKADYVGPVVARISRLQEEIQALHATKARLESHLLILPKLTNVSKEQLPPGYRELIETVSTELHDVIRDYNKLLDEYLNETISILVFVKQAPTITLAGFSARSILLVIVVSSIFMAFVALAVENMFRAARQAK